MNTPASRRPELEGEVRRGHERRRLGESPYGTNTERRAVDGTGDGTDATAVNATTVNATAVDHVPPLAKMSHLTRGGVFSAADSVRTRSRSAMVCHHAEGGLFGCV